MIADISLNNFRSYDNESFEFSKAVNIIVGPNASGKTNLLESILVVSLGSSYRVKDSDLIKFNKPWSKVAVNTFQGIKREARLKTENNLTKKQFVIDDKNYKRLSVDKLLPTVLFEPNHLQMLVGAPEQRRTFIDGLLTQIMPGYSTMLRQYKRVVAQRNRLLKMGPSTGGQLFVWNIRLSELGSNIAGVRADLVSKIQDQSELLYNQLSGQKNKITVKYLPTASLDNYASELMNKLEKSAALDFERGFTAYGPHREDIEVSFNGSLLPEVASRGENRTMTLVFKVLEAKFIEAARQQKPILLFDDVFSELDGARRQALTRFLKEYQAFITTTDADVVIQHFTEEAKIIPISKNL